MAEIPIIDEELCISCGACIALCPNDVFAYKDNDKAVVINPKACNNTGNCTKICPTEAIIVVTSDDEEFEEVEEVEEVVEEVEEVVEEVEEE